MITLNDDGRALVAKLVAMYPAMRVAVRRALADREDLPDEHTEWDALLSELYGEQYWKESARGEDPLYGFRVGDVVGRGKGGQPEEVEKLDLRPTRARDLPREQWPVGSHGRPLELPTIVSRNQFVPCALAAALRDARLAYYDRPHGSDRYERRG